MIVSAWKAVAMLLSACCGLAAAATTANPFLIPVLKNSHGELLLQSREAIKDNPQASMKCFQTYSSKSSVLSQDLKNSEALCKEKDAKARSLLPLQTAGKRNNLTETVKDICAKFSECSKQKKPLDFFRCYECAANANTLSANWIEWNAQEGVRLIEISSDVIEFERQTCSNAAMHAFLAGGEHLKAELDTCINGVARCSGDEKTSAQTLLSELDIKINGDDSKLPWKK